MKDKVTIQRTWGDWLDQLAVTYGFSPSYKANIGVEFAKEVDWAIRTPDLAGGLTARIAKTNAQLEAFEGTLSGFDPYWQYRLQLMEWMAT